MSSLNLKSARGPLGFVSRKMHPQSFLDKRTCASAPTQANLDQIADWDWKIGHAVDTTKTPNEWWNGHNFDDDDTRAAVEEEVIVEAAVDKPSRGHARNVRDYMDPSSSDSVSDVDDDVDTEEPYEYWEKAWSYSRSPFSNCSSLSFETSGNEEVEDRYESDDIRAIDVASTLSFDIPSSRAIPSCSSDTSIIATCRWTRMVNGAASCPGSTSI